MDRREALKRVALILGGAISAPVINAVLSGCQFGDPWKPRTLTAAQDEIITIISDMIIPETETPGAKAVFVNRFVDLIVTDWYKDKDRQRFLNGLAEFEQRCQKAFGKSFQDTSPPEKIQLLTELDNEGVAIRMAGQEDVPFFAMLKELTLVGYYTSEIGIKQELTYKPVPGHFEACVPAAEIGKAWARVY